MKSNKSPDIDKIPVEFYRASWDLLCDDLLEVFSAVVGEPSLSQKTGIIRLLYKKNDHRDLRNWRPILLLTADYKILAKRLANRITSVLAGVCSPSG